MKNAYRLDIDDGVYKLGDLNLFLNNAGGISYPPPDPQRPARPFFTGEIKLEVTVKGETRPFLLYIPQDFPISGAGIFLYPEDRVSCEEFLSRGNWRAVSEETKAALIVLEARPGGWSQADIQSEVEYSEAVFKRAIAREYYSLNEATYYIMGLGQGAYPATAYGLLSSSLFSCILADGQYQLDSRLLEQLGHIQSDRDAVCSKLEVVMPVWLVNRDGEDGGAVLEALKKANHSEDRGLRTPYGRLFQPAPQRWQSTLDALPITEVQFTSARDAAALSPEALHREMVLFALRFKRWLSIGNGCFRAARSWEDMGLKRFKAEIDGRLREWYVYEPTAYRKDPEKKLPALLAIHGYSCTGALFAENSEWHAVGERRDFFVVYVSAYPSNRNSGGKTVPLPTWNSIGMTSETDDVHYISVIMDQVKKRYPVDSERVYVSGHSNGSLFTQKLMAEAPLGFAAFAPQGAQYHMRLSDGPTGPQEDIQADGVLRPVWLMMGAEDIGDADSLAPGSANDRFLDMMCRVNGLDRQGSQCLENGKYRTWTYFDSQGAPLLRFTGVQDMPHTYTPEIAQIYWDQFLCHFRRRADGSIVYMP